ncbi:MAG TPA: AIR synthase-related protein, partial [Casimicrobiaceae bacterium]|nr:AIR synthase-related protein [Casimicrobiaceae bacterium]
RLERAAWPRPAIFEWLQKNGGVSEVEMHRVFNCGIGMALIVDAQHVAACRRDLESAGETVHVLGHVVPRPAGEPATTVV